jgi:hypothetical protein
MKLFLVYKGTRKYFFRTFFFFYVKNPIHEYKTKNQQNRI